MQATSLRRRAFFTGLAGAAAWPLAGRAQRSERLRRVGVLMPGPEKDWLAHVTSFADALGRLGWSNGRNVRIECRYAANDPSLFSTDAEDLVGLAPDALLATTPPALIALTKKTRIIPIVFVLVVDPVGMGLVQSLARPGGNITGFGALDPPIMGKWLQLLKEMAPNITRVAVIFNPDTQPYAKFFNGAIEAAAESMRVAVTLAPVRDDATIRETIAAQARGPGGGLVCLPDSFTGTHRDLIIAAAALHGLPLIGVDVFPRAGGLMSYWYDAVELHAEAASYIDRILKGASAADLPVQQATKYSLIINLKTAKALGLAVPPSMLDLADEVIE
jgi:putative ABC transport system substrate-binding protein